jgi:putative adhesin
MNAEIFAPRARLGHRPPGRRAASALYLTIALLLPWTPVRASRTIQEHRAADPEGMVEIVNTAGTVEVDGWDRNEIDVGGSAGEGVDRVDVTTAGNHTSIQVIMRGPHGWSSDGEARLIVHVPAGSTVAASLVSATLKVAGLKGDLKVQSISGDVKGNTGGGSVEISTVSGYIHLEAPSARNMELSTTSGDLLVKGGGGEVDVTTVSGTAKLELAEVSRGRFKSVSGDVSVQLSLKPSGQLESESVSGDATFKFAALPDAQFDARTLSGDIENCFGPKPMRPEYGPGSRLQFSSGEGRGRVRMISQSGDVKFCAPGGQRDSGTHSEGGDGARTARAIPAAARNCRYAMAVPYVF